MRFTIRPRDPFASRVQIIIIALTLVFLFLELRVHRHLYPTFQQRTAIQTLPPFPLIIKKTPRVVPSLAPTDAHHYPTTQPSATRDQAVVHPPLHNGSMETSKPLPTDSSSSTTTPQLTTTTDDDSIPLSHANAWLTTCQSSISALRIAAKTCEEKPCLTSLPVEQKPTMLRVELIHPLIAACRRVKNELPHGVVYLQYLDKSFVEMTKNWICNVIGLETVLPRNVFVVTDSEAQTRLTEFSKQEVESKGYPPLNIVLVEYVPKGGKGGGLSYGTLPYYDLMLFRTGINYQLLAAGIDIFIIESDAVWHSDPSEMIFSQPGDVVTSNDMSAWQAPGISHGFSLWRSKNPRVLEFVDTLATHQEKNLGADGDAGNEQFQMMRLFGSDFRDLRLTFLPNDLFTNGLRFTEKIPENKLPHVRQNNYVVGNDVKIARAKSAGWWYLTSDGKACARTVGKTGSSGNGR